MPVENVGFFHAFAAALSVILVSEIGDKTFFIAAIMAMRHPRLTVFAGAIFALALMTVLSGKVLILHALDLTHNDVDNYQFTWIGWILHYCAIFFILHFRGAVQP